MIGKRLPVLTLEKRGIALSDNYLKVELAREREPNQLIDVPIAGLAPNGLREG